MITSCILVIIGIVLLAIPIFKLIISCKSASDITWTLGQAGGMRNGILFYILCAIIGGAMVTYGILSFF